MVILFSTLRLLVGWLAVWLTIWPQYAYTNKPDERKPNIILILADDLGYETLGCYGNDNQITPNLDRLSASGMTFTNCYATPLCTPSRVQLMTGKYNHRNYIGFGLLDPNERTIGHMMKAQGYETCIAGKWQLLGSENQQNLAGGRIGTRPENAGFDSFLLWQVDTVGSRYQHPTVYGENRESITLPHAYGPDLFLQHINSFITENKEKPFFVYYPMCLPHSPFGPTPPQSTTSGEGLAPNSRYFNDMVAYMDKLVGQLVSHIDELGLLEETIILFVGDNGTDQAIVSHVNGTEIRGNKGSTNDRGTHVPLIANWKGRLSGESINTSLIDFTDFVPTLLQLSGASKKQAERYDGKSFYPQLFGDYHNKRSWIFTHYEPGWGNFQPRSYAQDTTWKVYKTGEIYHLPSDLDELEPISIFEVSRKEQRQINRLKKVIRQLYKTR